MSLDLCFGINAMILGILEALVDSNKLEHGCRMVYARFPSFVGFQLEDSHLSMCCLLLYRILKNMGELPTSAAPSEATIPWPNHHRKRKVLKTAVIPSRGPFACFGFPRTCNLGCNFSCQLMALGIDSEVIFYWFRLCFVGFPHAVLLCLPS